MREEWWTIAIHYDDGIGGARSFPTREAAEAALRENEQLGFGHGKKHMRGRMTLDHHVRVRTEWHVSDATKQRIDAEDAAYAAKAASRTKKRAKT